MRFASMEIMGSTLAHPSAFSQPFYSQDMGPGVLQRLEKTAWIGCPAYLLEVIIYLHAQKFSKGAPTPEYSLSFLREDDGSTPSLSTATSAPERAEIILRHIYAFDPDQWAEEMQSTLFLTDLSKRIALASAYKAAVYLYAKQVLLSPTWQLTWQRMDNEDTNGHSPVSSTPTAPSPSPPLAIPNLPAYNQRQASADLHHHLSVILPSDEHFKCTIWLTFIAGAEATTARQRRVTLERLDNLWNTIASVNVQNAAGVLQQMWLKRHEVRQRAKIRRQPPSTTVSDDAEVIESSQPLETKPGSATSSNDRAFRGLSNDDDDNAGDLGDNNDDDDDDDDADDGFYWIEELDRSTTDWLFI
jgi:hypothetical protein